MGHKMSQAHLDIYKGIDAILWNDWDPASVHGKNSVEMNTTDKYLLSSNLKLAELTKKPSQTS